METNIQIIRSRRRTVSLEIKRDGQVLLRCPYGMSRAAIEEFLFQKEHWLRSHLESLKCKAKEEQPHKEIETERLKQLYETAKEQIPERVAYYAKRIGVDYGRITIRKQKTRWGSCSSRGNLNFNCLLMQAPVGILDYVIVHELCHRLEMNHSPKFWALVEKTLPDYKVRRKWLKEHGEALMYGEL